MSFWPLVRFLIKIAIASIPAGMVIAFFYMVLGWIYGAILIATHTPTSYGKAEPVIA